MNLKTYIIKLLTVILTFLSLTSLNIPNLKKDYVKFNKNLLASRYEVTNKEYREFLKDLKTNKQLDKYAKYLYDSAQWLNKFNMSFNEPMKKNYHSHPAYDNYPIVNITLDAAKSYCEWLTTNYNASAKKKYKKVVFRLPSEQEWKTLSAALPGHNLPWYGNFPYTDSEGKIMLANIKTIDNITAKTNYVFDGGLYPLIVGHYKPNSIGLYDIIGNVAEMTLSGLIKGGSWDSFLEECTIDKTQTYTIPDPRVGFRVIMEIIEN